MKTNPLILSIGNVKQAYDTEKVEILAISIG